jgi:hypothetical protein
VLISLFFHNPANSKNTCTRSKTLPFLSHYFPNPAKYWGLWDRSSRSLSRQPINSLVALANDVSAVSGAVGFCGARVRLA